MIGTMLLVAMGGALLALFIFFLLRFEPKAEEVLASGEDTVAEAGTKCEAELLDRVFASEDWEFLESRGPAKAQQAFLEERKEIARCWLSGMERRANAAMLHHVRQARRLGELQPLVECRIAVSYLFLQVNCGLLRVMIAVRGPVGLRKAVGRARRIGAKLPGLADGAIRVSTLVTRTQGD